MTIALGVMCSDGLVLGVDLQYTQDGITKMPGQKLFWLCPGRPYSVAIAASGNPDVAKEIVNLSEETILAAYPSGVPTVTQIKACVQQALRRVYLEHIDIAPARDRLALVCDILLGIQANHEANLFYSNRTMLIRERDTKCLGIGLFFSNYALASMLPLSPSVEVAAQVVTYTIALAKDFVESVGHGSDIHMLYADGRHDSIVLPERDDIETGFRLFYAHLQGALNCVDTDSVPDEGVALRMAALADDLNNLRSLQRKRRSRTWRSKNFGDSEDRGSSIRDRQPLPPSQESPEGSDES